MRLTQGDEETPRNQVVQTVDHPYDIHSRLLLREETLSDGRIRHSVVTEDGARLINIPPSTPSEAVGAIYQACVAAEWLGGYRVRTAARALLVQD